MAGFRAAYLSTPAQVDGIGDRDAQNVRLRDIPWLGVAHGPLAALHSSPPVSPRQPRSPRCARLANPHPGDGSRPRPGAGTGPHARTAVAPLASSLIPNPHPAPCTLAALRARCPCGSWCGPPDRCGRAQGGVRWGSGHGRRVRRHRLAERPSGDGCGPRARLPGVVAPVQGGGRGSPVRLPAGCRCQGDACGGSAGGLLAWSQPLDAVGSVAGMATRLGLSWTHGLHRCLRAVTPKYQGQCRRAGARSSLLRVQRSRCRIVAAIRLRSTFSVTPGNEPEVSGDGCPLHHSLCD